MVELGRVRLKLVWLSHRHPWVDTAGRLSFPALDRWAPGQSSLARVVTEATGSLSGQTARADSSPSPSRSGMQAALPANMPSMVVV